MNTVFENIIQMSFNASFIILALCALRLVLRRSPRWFICSLWFLAAIRLIIPFTIESEHSLIPSTEPIVQMVKTNDEAIQGFTSNDNYLLWQGKGTADAGDPVTDDSVGTQKEAEDNIAYNEGDGSATSSPKGNTQNNLRVFLPYIWLIGVAAVLAYGIVGYILLYRRSAPFIPAEGKIRESEFIFSPFILGVFRPKIYLPKGLHEPLRSHVIAHENAHLQRRDHLIKPIGFIILAFHWFNPLVWLAYILLSRDIEMACDERVIGGMSIDARSSYAESLLNYCTGNARVTRRLLNACPIAFGEVSMKKRIKAVADFKRPAAWVIALSLVSAVLVGALFFTNDVAESNADEEAVAVETVKEWNPELTTADFTDENGIVRWPAELLPAGVPDPTSYITEINLVEKMGDEVHIIFTSKVTVADMEDKDYNSPYCLFLNQMHESDFVYFGNVSKTLEKEMFGFASKDGYYLEPVSFSNHTYSDEYEDYDSDISKRLKKYADKYLERGEQKYFGDIPVGDAITIGETVELTLTVRDDIPEAIFYDYPDVDTSLGLDEIEFTEWPTDQLPVSFPNANDFEGLDVRVYQDDTGLTVEVSGPESAAFKFGRAVSESGFILLTRDLRVNENGDYIHVHEGWLDGCYPGGPNWGVKDPHTVDTYKICYFNDKVITE